MSSNTNARTLSKAMREMLLAEFDTPEKLAAAIRDVRGRGFQRLEAHTPYSTEAVRDALNLGKSRLPLGMFAGASLGAAGAYGLQWYTVAYDYPLNVGGRPPHMPLAFVPITFEMGVLLAAFTAFFGVLLLGRLVVLWHPVFEADGFDSASIDKFWLRVELPDPSDASTLGEELLRLGARRSVLVPARQR